MGTHSATERLRDIDLKRRGLAASAFLFIYLLILGLLKGKARRVIAEILCYIMLTTLCPSGLQLQSAAAPVSTWQGLSDALINGGDYILNEDITAPEGAEGFLVVNDASLNLNGHTIDAAGNITDSAVISVEGTLRITNDSGLSAPMGGYIKGGCNREGNGGGIYIAKSGTLNMDGGAIVDCTAKNGGGIFSEGNLYFGGGKVGEQGHGNHAIENGGGIFLSRTYGFDVENAVLIGNEAGDYGGGIFINGEDGFNSDDIGSDQENVSTVSEDKANTVSEDKEPDPDFDTESSAGEKSVSPDSVERFNLRSASLSFDTASIDHSGSRFLWPNGESANLTFNIKNISSCSADYGGAIAFGNTDGSSNFLMTSCIFNVSNICSNTANKAGGGMYMGLNLHSIPAGYTCSTQITSGSFYLDNIYGNSAEYGGAVSIGASNCNWYTSTIHDNTATYGGAIAGGDSHTFHEGCIIEGNSGVSGGALYVKDNILMSGASIINNTSTYCPFYGDGTIQGYGNLDNNRASDSNHYSLEIGGGSGCFDSIICSSGTLSVKNGDGVFIHSANGHSGSLTINEGGCFTVGNCLIVDSGGTLTCSAGATCEVSGGSGLVFNHSNSGLSLYGGTLKATGCSNGGIELHQSLTSCYGSIICENCTSGISHPVLQLTGLTQASGKALDIIIRNCSGTAPLMNTIGEITVNNITMENNEVTGSSIAGGIIKAENQRLNFNSINATGNHIGESASTCTGGLINAGNVTFCNGYSIRDNTIGGSSTHTRGGLIYAGGITLGGSGQITDNSIGGNPTDIANSQGPPVYVSDSSKNLNLSGTPYIAGNTYLDNEANRKECNVGLASGAKINVTSPLGAGSLISITPPGALPESATDPAVDINDLFETGSYYAGKFVCDNEHLYFRPGTTTIGYHDHVWSYSEGGSSVTGHCATHGCRYENVTLTLNPPESSRYDGQPKVVTLTGYPVSDVTDLEPEPAGVVYYKTEESGSTTPFGSPLSGPPSDRGCYVAMFTWAGKTGVLAFSIGEPKVPLIGNSKYASSKDNFAPLSPKGKISKQQLDFSMVKGSGVNPKDLRMTAIKGSKFTTVAKIAEGKTAKSTGSVKVKVNKKTRTATVKCKKTGKGTVTLPMEDGVTYTITFTVDKPKGMNTTIPVGSSSVTMTTKDMFNTDIDSGDLMVSSKKGVSKASVSADNVLIIEPNGRDTLKVRYKYMNKKYKATVKVK